MYRGRAASGEHAGPFADKVDPDLATAPRASIPLDSRAAGRWRVGAHRRIRISYAALRSSDFFSVIVLASPLKLVVNTQCSRL